MKLPEGEAKRRKAEYNKKWSATDAGKVSRYKSKKKYVENNRRRVNDLQNEYRKRHPDRVEQTRKNWMNSDRDHYLECLRRSTDRRRGINHKEAERLRNKIKICMICGSINKLTIDHDHKTGRIRGVLCQRCNLVIGLFGDKIELFQAAMDWVSVE